MEYGTGAIMAVPAHDERDREFAETFDLPIREVIDEDGVLVNSGEFTGLPADEAKRAIVEWLAEQGKAAAGGQLPAARLELLAAALLGLPDSDHPLRRLRPRSGAGGRAAGPCCPRSRTTGRRACRRWRPTRSG